MAEKSNIFTTDHEAFFEKLADLGHFRAFVGWQLRLARESCARSLDVVEKQGYKNQYGAMNGMSILNIFHDGKLDIRAPFGKRVTQGEDIIPKAEEMERRFNSFLLVWVFEELEKHVQKLYGKLLYQLRDSVPVSEKKAFHKRFPKWANQQRTPQYFEAYAAYLWKTDDKGVLIKLEEHLAWERVTYRDYNEMPWRIYIETIAFCRHHIVHNDGRVSVTKLNKLTECQRVYVESCLHTSLMSPHRHLLPSKELIDGLFEAVASYEWAIYVLISKRCGMADESQFFRPKNGGPRKVQPK